MTEQNDELQDALVASTAFIEKWAVQVSNPEEMVNDYNELLPLIVRIGELETHSKYLPLISAAASRVRLEVNATELKQVLISMGVLEEN